MYAVAVYDTNILLSALVSLRGSPFRCIAAVRTKLVESVTCREILAEFEDKLRDKFGFSRDEALQAAEQIRSMSRSVVISGELKAVPADPSDDKILECALVGGATHVVTGDKRHLLPLRSFRGILIVTANEFLTRVARTRE